MLRLALACSLAAKTAALKGPNTTPAKVGCQRSRIFAQLAPGWYTAVDEATGTPYYCEEQTGQCQWEPPQLQAASSPALWLVAPTDGVSNEYSVRNGEEQILGRFDMVEQSPYVSRMQCVVRVAADGTASVQSIGKAQTFIIKPGSTAWSRCSVILGKDETHALSDGEQIALNKDQINGVMHGLFTVYEASAYQQQQGWHDLQQGGGYGHGQYGQQQGGYEQQQGGYQQQQGGYEQQQGGYEQQQGGYEQQQDGYAQQQGGYAQQGGYQQGSDGYPPQQVGY